LNVSAGKKSTQKTKIYGIAKLRTDIIFLSDVRINEQAGNSNKVAIEHIFKFNPYRAYDCYFNSSKSARGVGILIGSDLNYSVEESRCDENENILVLKVKVEGNLYTMGAVYGPNSRDVNFFNSLTRFITDLGSDRIILGGDWNCVPSTAPVEVNIDCINMINVPNPGQSVNLARFMENNNMCDIYRAKFPLLREFTYAPYGTIRKNRSRIDFVLINRGILHEVRDAVIGDSKISKLFDHKPVFCRFTKKQHTGRRAPTKIGRLIFKDPEVQIIAKASAIETYLHNVIPEAYGVDRLNRAKLTLANCWNLLKLVGPNPTHLHNWQVTPEELENREEILAEINNIINGFDLPVLEVLPLSCSAVDLYVNLTMSLKNELSSHQAFVWRTRNATKNRLKSKLEDFRITGNVTCAAFYETEDELAKFMQYELEAEIEQSQFFEQLSFEKPSNYLSTLIKGSKKSVSQTVIKDDMGIEFDSPEARNRYITDYFKEIYKKGEISDLTIEGFLGENILNHELVRESKLSEAERLELERPVLISELDLAVKDIKINTAAGIDGFANLEIKSFWGILRYPLFVLLTEVLGNSSLPAFLKQAGIKLIPKKGCAENISNWRPISLLSCTYKIMSKVLNNRLKKAAERVLTRAQKGFVRHRDLHEVLINIIERISYIKKSDSPGALVAVDFKKAFDSISHDYMMNVLRFFGFGDYMINFVKTCTMGRSARIYLDNGNLSEPFPLERGNAQGDSPSPLLFNFAIQILVLKIELSAEIIPAPGRPVSFRFEPPPEQFKQRLECNRETDKSELFADDAHIFCAGTAVCIMAVRQTLTVFKSLSGLECNIEKTGILLINVSPQETANISECGFRIAREIKVLGITIDLDLTCLTTAGQQTVTKLEATVQFWQRFNLSLQGRINIAKTYLYSQISYTGCIITPSNAQIGQMETIIGQFVKNRMQISQDRVFKSPEIGGLGLPNIGEYITALQCSWIKKCCCSSNDLWRHRIWEVTNGNCLIGGPNLVTEEENPILHNILSSWCKFIKCYYARESNFKKMYILNNPMLERGGRVPGITDITFFNQQPVLNLDTLSRLRFDNIVTDGRIKEFQLLRDDTGLQFSPATYLRLAATVRNFFTNYPAVTREGKSGTWLNTYVFSFKKGSKNFRQQFTKEKSEKTEMVRNASVQAYHLNNGLNLPNETTIKKLYGGWVVSFYTNNMREFVFKLINNLLPVKTRQMHYVQGITRGCTFCELKTYMPAPDETVRHLFYDCPTVTVWRLGIIENYCGRAGPSLMDPDFWLSRIDNALDKNDYVRFLKWSYLHTVWEFKLRKKTPGWLTFNEEFSYAIRRGLKISPLLQFKYTLFNNQYLQAPARG